MQSSSRSLASLRQKTSLNSFRLLKKLPSSYGRKKLSKEATATKNTYQQDDDDVLSDNSCGTTRNDIPSGSHDQDTTPFDEENNTLQLFDDDDDDDNTNNDSLEKTKEPAAISKHIKPSLGE